MIFDWYEYNNPLNKYKNKTVRTLYAMSGDVMLFTIDCNKWSNDKYWSMSLDTGSQFEDLLFSDRMNIKKIIQKFEEKLNNKDIKKYVVEHVLYKNKDRAVRYSKCKGFDRII